MKNAADIDAKDIPVREDTLTPSQAARRHAHEQALASSRLAGHVPTAEFLADCKAHIVGTLSHDEVRARSLARALAKDREARSGAAESGTESEAE